MIWGFIKLILWVIFVYALLTSFLTHFILWLELRLQSLHNDPPIKLPLFKLAKGFTLEILCVMLFFITSLLRFLIPKRQPSQSLPENALPILFVHGYLHDETAWLWFKHQLQKNQNIGPMFTINLVPPFASIATLAEKLQTKVQEIQSKTAAKSVILVGHSMGGLVSSYYCEYLAKPNEIAKIITLGSPFKGTRSTALCFGENAREMAPHSSFLKQLLDRIQESSVPYCTIASKLDNMVIPWDSALLKDTLSKTDSLILEDHGHLRLLISTETLSQVSQWITEKPKRVR